MESTNFGTENFNYVNGQDLPVVASNSRGMTEEEELSETEADAPSLKFGGQYINTALEKLSRLRHGSGASNNSSNPPLDFTLNEEFTDRELYDLALRLQNASSEKIHDALLNISDGGFDLNSSAQGSKNTLLHAACSVPNGYKILIEMFKPDIMALGIQTNPENADLELPIHVALKYDHSLSVETLITHDHLLLYVVCQDGFGLIHKAAKYLAVESIKVIVLHDPHSVNTFPRNEAFKDASVIHIAIGSYRLCQSHGDQHNDDYRSRNKISQIATIHNVTSFFLERCSQSMIVRNGRSLVHQMIEIEDIEGLNIVFRKFQKERKFVNDFVNRPHHLTGRSALMTAIEKNQIDIAMLLLENYADPNAKIETVQDNRGQMASERAIQLSYEPKEVAPLLKSLIKHGAEIIPALEAVIDVADVTLARIIFDELPDVQQYINHKDTTSGETILYSCLGSYRLGDTEMQEIDNIIYLLEKGANVMEFKRLPTYEKDDIDSHGSSSLDSGFYTEMDKLPIHISVEIEMAKKNRSTNYWGKDRAKNFINAIKIFGLRNIFEQIILPPLRYTFLREHLLPAAYLVDHEAVHEFLNLLFSLNVPNIQNEVVHYCAPSSSYEIYQYPILHWATLYNRPSLMNSVVRAEYKVHQKQKEYGFHCFRKLENNALKQQAMEAYDDMFHKTPQWLNQVVRTVGEVIVMLYIFFALDIFFDLDIYATYNCLSESFTMEYGNRKNLNDTECVIYADKQEDACLDIYEGSTFNKSRYNIAAGLSIALTIPSIIAFLVMSYFNFTIPQKLLLTEHGDLNSGIHIQVWKGIVYLCKPIIFLVTHFIRALRSKAMPYDLFYKQKYDEGRLAWNLISRVEIGIEATGQLIVQLYVLSPLALQFPSCSKIAILKHIRNGLFYYASLTTLEATFEERMMAKFLMSSVYTCFSITLIRLSKNSANGLGSREAIICFFMSCLCQLTLRCMDLTLLFISGVHPNDVLWILVGHWILTFCLKLIFEVMSKKKKHESHIRSLKSVVSYIFNLLTTTLCSALVYVPMIKSEQLITPRDPNADNTFLSTFVYFMLMMVEHIILVGTTIYKTEALGENFKYTLYLLPLLLWVLALILLVVYYKFLHRSTTTGMIGPQLKDNSLDFHAVLCCEVKHCSINLCSCMCSSKDVDHCDSKCQQREKQSTYFNLNSNVMEPESS